MLKTLRYRRSPAAAPALLAGLLSFAPCQAEVGGRVVLEDALPPATPIVVELRCVGAPAVRAQADQQGRFLLAASAATGCTIAASLPGYADAAVPVDRLPLDPEIAGLVLPREGKGQGRALSSTTLAASEMAVEAFREAVRALRRGGPSNIEQAERLFARAADEDSHFAEAWFQLARLRLARSDLSGARQALEASLAADPWYLSPYRPLLMLQLVEERWQDARTLCDEWLRLTPELPDVHYHRALAALELGDVKAAQADLSAIEAGPGRAGGALAHHLRGRILESQGRLSEALAAYRSYLAADPDGLAADEARAKLQQAEAP